MYSVKSVTETSAVLEMRPEYCQPAPAPLACSEAAAPLARSEAEDDIDGEGNDTPENLAMAARKPIDVSKAKKEVTVPLADLPAVMRLTHAMCYYTVQGRSLRDHSLLLHTADKEFCRRALIVGLSKATNGDFVHVASSQDAILFSGERCRVLLASANRIV